MKFMCLYVQGWQAFLCYSKTHPNMFQLVSENVIDDGDDDDTSIQRIARIIKQDVQKLPIGKSEYSTIETENLFDECSNTLLTLLSKISPNFEISLGAAMIGNIVTSVLAKSFTKLQLSLGILDNDKKLIEHLQEYRITSSYPD